MAKKVQKKSVKKAAIYARVSSTANKDGAGISRQTAVCKAKCENTKTPIICKVAEVVSGSLPLQKRTVFNELLQKCSKQNITSVYVEGTRAFARNAAVAEAIYEKTKDLGIHIIPVDLPDLMDHNPNPAQKFMRRVMFAYTELEKDITVQRLQHGWKQKLQTEKAKQRSGQQVRLSLKGKVKINGRKGLLDKNLSGAQRKQLKAKCLNYSKGNVTVRELAKQLSSILKTKQAGFFFFLWQRSVLYNSSDPLTCRQWQLRQPGGLQRAS